jgi:hypothetical protein
MTNKDTLLREKQQLEERIKAIDAELNKLDVPQSMEQVRRLLKESWDWDLNKDAPINSSLYRGFRTGFSISESCELQVQALRDVQAICKVLNDIYGGDGKCFVLPTRQWVAKQEDSLFNAITNLKSPEACEDFISLPYAMEALKRVYTAAEV